MAQFPSFSTLFVVNAAPKAVSPLDRLLSEGLIHEEVYYRALARHLGCEYYCGEPPLAVNFDAMRGLRSGVAPLEFHPRRPRAVIAPRAQYVPRLMEAAQSSRLLSGSFALASPQRFAGLMRARRGKELLDVALGRLPASLSARRGMTWAQIAAVGVVVASASALGVASFEAFHAAAIAALWLMFSASVILRSTAAVASNGEVRPPMLADDELPDYTVVAALYRERRVAEQLVRALDALDKALNSDTWEEAPHELKNWFRQRVRWQKGWMQTLIVHSRRPIFFHRDLGLRRAVAATTLIAGAIFGGLFWPAFALETIWRALTVGDGALSPSREMGDVFTYILALAGIWAIVMPLFVAAKLRGFKLTSSELALLPVYYLLVTAATWAAMFHLVMWPYYWGKTDHGRSRLRPALGVVRAQSST